MSKVAHHLLSERCFNTCSVYVKWATKPPTFSTSHESLPHCLSAQLRRQRAVLDSRLFQSSRALRQSSLPQSSCIICHLVPHERRLLFALQRLIHSLPAFFLDLGTLSLSLSPTFPSSYTLQMLYLSKLQTEYPNRFREAILQENNTRTTRVFDCQQYLAF